MAHVTKKLAFRDDVKAGPFICWTTFDAAMIVDMLIRGDAIWRTGSSFYYPSPIAYRDICQS